jgi:putative flippase GtrA
VLFFTVAILLLILASIFLAFLIHSLLLNPLVAKFITLPLSAVIKYIVNRKYTFN